MRHGPLVLSLLLAVSGGCGDDPEPEPEPGPEPAFPEDYAASYIEVRDCRQSGDHDLNRIRILADPVAVDIYQNRDLPFPEGSVILKEEYEFDDMACAGPLKQWTVMVKLADGENPEQLDWRWQRVDAERQVAAENEPKCYGCHTGCTPEAGGYDFTCAMP